jgi:histidinol-phosphate phosphatase family protein
MDAGATQPAAFLDRDGTLIEDPGYLSDPAQVRLLPGAATAIAKLRVAGYLPVVISNQSGVGRGYFGEAAVQAVNRRLTELLLAADPAALLTAFYFCPHAPDDGCPCRKPRPGLLLRAAAELHLDLPRSLCFGDHPRDLAAAHAAGCPTAKQVSGPHHPSLLQAVSELLTRL